MTGRFFESDDDDKAPEVIRDEPRPEGKPGTDPSEVVTVVVDDNANVLDVRLKHGWQRTVDPRELHGSVLAAMHAARMQSLSERESPVWQFPAASGNDVAFGRNDALRLFAAVRVDLDAYLGKLRDSAARTTTATSSGGHVQVHGRVSGITGVNVDAKWARNARDSEIETELREALAQFTRSSSLGELAGGPRSPAISELLAVGGAIAETLRKKESWG